MKKIMILAILVAAAVSCRKEPSSSQFDGEFLVYTARSDKADFSGYSTFTVADSLLYVEGNKGRMALDSWCRNVREQYISAMEDLGYTYVDTGKLDSDQTTDAPEEKKAPPMPEGGMGGGMGGMGGMM